MYQTFQIDEQEQSEKQKTSVYKFADKYSNFLKPNFIISQQQQEYHQKLSSVQASKQSWNRQEYSQSSQISLARMNNIEFSVQNNSKPLQRIKKKEKIKQEEIEQKREQPIITPSLKDNVLFLYDQDEDQLVDNQSQNIQIPSRTLGEIYGIESDDQNEAQAETENILITKTSQYFDTQNNATLIGQLLACIEKSHVLKLQLKRQNSGLNLLWPQYQLSFKNENAFVFAKRTTARPIATYIFSLSPKDFEQSSSSYLGKLKTNIMGNILYIYGPGLNPKNAEEKKVPPREMLATIVYQASFMNQTKPRSFYVYVRHPDKPYYSLKGTKPGQQIGLDQLYLHSQENRQNIAIYQNSKPEWNSKVGGFMLDFKGRVRQPSVKNFILQDMHFKQVMMFGKWAENEFTIQVQDRFSPLITFGIALSAFDSKFLCQ